MKTIPVTFGIAFFAIAMISGAALNDASAVVDDGELTKYSPSGKYKVDMSWKPAGPIEPGKDYIFNFKISDSVTDRVLSFVSYDLAVVQNGVLVEDLPIKSASKLITKSLFFNQAGMTHILLSDINGSGQEVDFTFLVDRDNSINKQSGLIYTKKVSAEPQIYFCGWEKNAKTLKDCFKTETYEGYGWFGKINVMIYAPGWNHDEDRIEWIGNTAEEPITFHSRSEVAFNEVSQANGCGLIETGANTGLFVGRMKLSGYDYDVNGDGTINTGLGGNSCSSDSKSPFKEAFKIESGRNGAVTVNWKYANDPVEKYATATATYHWNMAKIDFQEDVYSVNDKATFKFYDKDVYGMNKDKATITFKVYSDSDKSGITIEASQHTNYKFKKAFEFFMTTTEESSGETLHVTPGDTIYVEYEDFTLPEDAEGKIGGPYQKGDSVDIISTAIVTR